MEFELSTEQKLMQDSARQMVERDVQPIIDRHDPKKSLPKAAMLEIFGHLKHMGLMAPRLSEKDGGSGLSMLNYGLIYEQLPPFLAIGVMGHECTIARIFAEATPEQKEMFLPDLFEGKKITGTATTEPGVGSNPREVTTRVVEDGNELVINGRKMWCSNASLA
ncbi:MAG: acyl-CoA dehydrogenase family protein, partial [Rickettsiales bacterium]